jgi:hypothetical protein
MATLFLAMLASLGVVGVGATGVSAQDPITDVTVIDGYDLVRPPSECIGFLPLPDCGKEPVDAGDRGGALQYLTFGVILAGLGFIFTVVFRQVIRGDRAKAEQAYAAEQAPATSPTDPNTTSSSH